ncbi:MAG TPA: hypothetical protein VGM87_24430 [Roseomonas sp.]|jgi:hypothetical protein
MPNKDPDLAAVVSALPGILRESCVKAREGWQGSTTDMMRASYDVIQVLQGIWLILAKEYPDRHFGGLTPEDYIQKFVQGRFEWHRALNEPGGVGTGGTVVGPMSASSVMMDLEGLVEQTVLALMNRGIHEEDAARYEKWLKAWRKASKSKV